MQASPFSIRPVGNDDDLDELHFGNPAWMGASLTRELVANSGDALLVFTVAVAGRRLVAYAEGFLPRQGNPSMQGRCALWVRPDARGQGIGTALWNELRQVGAARGAKSLTSSIDPHDERAIAWLTGIRGLTGALHLESRLDLGDNLSSTGFPPGITIDTLGDNPSEHDWQETYAAHVRLAKEPPDARDHPASIPYQIYRTLIAEPWQVATARTSDRSIVGLTSVFVRSERDRSVNTMLTAVNREWRGKGLAAALKTTHAITLRDAGWRSIVTQNMEGNDRILAVNRRLGFQPSRSTLDALYDFAE